MERSKGSAAKTGAELLGHRTLKAVRLPEGEGTQVPIEHRDTWAALYISYFDQRTEAGTTTETQQLGIRNTTAILRITNSINGLGVEGGESLEVKCMCADEGVKFRSFKRYTGTLLPNEIEAKIYFAVNHKAVLKNSSCWWYLSSTTGQIKKAKKRERKKLINSKTGHHFLSSWW